MSVVQLSLWDYLDRAAATPAAVDWSGLLAHLDRSLELLPIGEQLATAGEALRRLGEIYGDRSALTLAEIGYLAHPEQEPCLPLAAFDVYVRQSSWVDLEQFIEAPDLPEVLRGYERGSVVRELSVAEALTQIEDEVTTQTIDSQTAYELAIGLAHDEDVSAWSAAIVAKLEEQERPVSLLELQESLQMPLVQVWLALLLNGMRLEQRGEFYRTEGVWIWR